MKKKSKHIFDFILIISLVIIVVVIYNKYNYNSFNKSVEKRAITEFTRDKNIKCSKADSYKVESKEYNKAFFYESVNVEKNTPYKVSCKVKTKDIENQDERKDGGANISILNSSEQSISISGTSEWQDLVLYFNSKDREKVDIAFGLDGIESETKGTAWFSDFKIERGNLSTGNTWKFACFIFPKIDVNVMVNGKKENVNLVMSQTDIDDIKTNMQRFQENIQDISHGKMQIKYDVFVIDEPITTLSYDEENGFFVSANDVHELIDKYVEKNEYDHIYVGIRMADKQKEENILVNDWIGLGGMDYFGIGFSNIRLPDDERSSSYKFNYRKNTFPEEVFLHEFLHTLERNSKEFGYEVPELHDYARYGYTADRLEGQKKWYEDYMNMEINVGNKKVGIPPEIYKYRPVHESNFKHSMELNYFKEPKNIIEVIRSLASRVMKLFQYTAEDAK